MYCGSPRPSYRGISDNELVDLANRDDRIALTRDSNFLKPSLRRRAVYGIVYIGEPVRKDNIERLAKNIAKALGGNEGKAPPSNSRVEYHRVIPLTQ